MTSRCRARNSRPIPRPPVPAWPRSRPLTRSAYAWVFVVAIVIVLVASALIVRIRNVKRHVPFIITLPRPATFASPAFSRMVLVGFHCCRMAAAAVHADDVAYDGHEYMKGRCVA